MGVRKGSPGCEGQMTVELMMILPVAIAVAVITVNALTFFGDCAAFDRLAADAVRAQAASPAFANQIADDAAAVQDYLEEQFMRDNLECFVAATSSADGLVSYEMSLSYKPTLFGMGLRSEVLGVPLPALRHSTSLTVDRYKPGVLL